MKLTLSSEIDLPIKIFKNLDIHHNSALYSVNSGVKHWPWMLISSKKIDMQDDYNALTTDFFFF